MAALAAAAAGADAASDFVCQSDTTCCSCCCCWCSYHLSGRCFDAAVAAVVVSADRTVASGEGALEYISTAAGLQQFKQTALTYVLLNAADAPLTEEELAEAAEAILRRKLQLQVCVYGTSGTN